MKQKNNKSKSISPSAKIKPALKSTQRNPYFSWFFLGGILILAIVVFFPMLQNQFCSWDDPDYITKNNYIKALNSENLKFIFTQPLALNYHPFTMLSLALNYHFSQLNPFSYYLTNLILHLLNIVLVFWFVYLLSKKNIHVALFTALIFGIHPMHVESVAWATERKDVLYTLFFLASIITWLYYIERKKIVLFGVAFAFALFSMFSKPAAIILPLVLIVIELYLNEKFEVKSLLNKIPFFIIAALFLYLTLNAQTTEDIKIGDYTRYNVVQRFLFACFGFVTYLVKFFTPVQLSILHPYPDNIGVLVFLSPLWIVLMLAGIYFFKAKRNLLIFGFLFYAVNLVLVLQFFAIGDSLYTERYTYVPYIGIAFVFSMLLFDSEFKLNKNMVWGVLLAASLFFSYEANARVKIWKSSESLWTDLIDKYPESNRGYYGRGNYYSDNNMYEKAIADYSKAIQIGIDHNGYTNRAVMYLQLHRYEEALKDFNDAIQLNPNQYKAYLGRGRVYLAMQQYEQAIKDANAAIAFRPLYDTYFFRGMVYAAMQKNDEAIADYTQAASLTNDVSIYNNRGSVYFMQQKYETAIEDFNRVLSSNPGDTTAIMNRANAYYKENQFEKAISDYNLLLNQNHGSAKLFFCVGMAYMQNNQADEAIINLQKATLLAPKNANYFANLAFAFQKKGNKPAARESAEKAMELGYVFAPDFLAKIK